MSLVEVNHLRVAFGTAPAVKDVSFSVLKGERFGIIGESGSGKTLTALSLLGLLPEGAAQRGSITFDGAPLPDNERQLAALRGKRIGMVFQEPMTALNPLKTAGSQIREAIRINRPDARRGEALEKLLAEVGLEPLHARRYPHQLSGGQRQRVMIAMALAGEPDLLIADEPTSALDMITQKRVLDLIDRVCTARGMALIFISHDLKAVAALCRKVMVMKAGDVVEQGAAKSVFRFPAHAYTKSLLAATQPRSRPLVQVEPGVGTLLEVQGVVRHFRQSGPLLDRKPLAAVNGVSFTIRPAESLALVGPSGCGKSTLARLIAGLDRVNSGIMLFNGRPYRGVDLPKAERRGISLVFQDPFGSFDPRLRVGDSVGEPLRLVPELKGPARRDRIAETIEAVGLSPDMARRYPHEFSGGQRQRLAIARALVTRPRLVVLDEPVSALDVSVRGDILALLNRLRADFGLAYLVISHDLDMVKAVAERVLVMDKGQIVEAGEPFALFAVPEHDLTKALISARLPEIEVPLALRERPVFPLTS